jgi:hypothetical protein
VKVKIIKHYNLICCFVWGETWSLTTQEEHRLRMFENRVQKRVFGHKREKVTGGWRELQKRYFIICVLYPVLLG